MRIGVDLDGVCYSFTDACKRWFEDNEFKFRSAPLPPVESWDFFRAWGLSGAEFWAGVWRGVAAGAIWHKGDVIPGTREGLEALRADGHSIHICTSRPDAEVETIGWLKAERIPYDTVTIATDKTMMNVDLFVDDYEGNWLALHAAGVFCLLWDQPWNRHVDGAARVHSWDQVADYAKFMATAPLVVSCAEIAVDPTTGAQKGRKLARYDLIPAGPLHALAEHFGKGALKYEDRNWEKGYPWSWSFAALNRHLWDWWNGKDFDEDGNHNLDAVMWHTFAAREFVDRHPDKDDRPNSHTAAA